MKIILAPNISDENDNICNGNNTSAQSVINSDENDNISNQTY